MRSGRHRIVVNSAALACWLIAWCPPAFALNPSLDVSQYAHNTWRISDGFAQGTINSIAQTPDGYLWLGTEFGLLRFDGVRALPWQPPPDQPLPSSAILGLRTARDGTLWIGTKKGLASWKEGKLTQYEALEGFRVGWLLEDREGAVWAGGLGIPAGRLCVIRNSRTACSGEDGRFGFAPFGMYEDRKGNLWTGINNGLWRWSPGPPTRFPLPGEETVWVLDEDRDGALLIATRSGIRRFVDGKAESYPLSGPLPPFAFRPVLHDRDGGVWTGTHGRGLAHVHQGKTDVFRESDGLSNDEVIALFEDREGDIWVATLNGLDRFRDFAVPTLSRNQGMPASGVMSVSASGEGSVWISTGEGLKKWDHDQLIVYRQRAATPVAGREIVGNGLPERVVESVFEDSDNRLWIATLDGFGYLEHNRFLVRPDIPARHVRAVTEDSSGNLWIAEQELGLLQVVQRQAVHRIPWAALGHEDFATVVIPDRMNGGLWLGFWDGGIAYFKDNQIRAAYGSSNGLAGRWVTGLRAERDGTLWVATAGGLSRLKDGHIATLTRDSGLPCDSAHWMVEDDDHSLWMNMACGVVRVDRSELDAWAADANRKIRTTVFGSSDGVRVQDEPIGFYPYVAKAADGKLWFVARDGVSVVDPRHLPFNSRPPPVHVEQIIADRKIYDAASKSGAPIGLPALTRDLQIDYTALSLVAPEKNRFRIKLEGWDREWQDVGNRRQAFYSNLPPRNYRFRVIASNNSGVWNEAGTALEFSVAPAYYQTLWFRLTLVAAALGLLAALYQLRLRRLAWQFSTRLEERVNERTRIARDLHDTLLQSFHAVLLRFRAVTYLLPDRPEDARKTLDNIIDEASDAIVDARNAVQGLRASTDPKTTLVDSLAALAKELGTDDSRPSPPQFIMHVEGTPGVLQPLVRDDVYRIAREALRNAFRHANARQIEADVRYDRRQFRLRIRDDGAGIDGGVLEGGRSGHFGLAGMRERAELLGGTFTLWSERGSGTEVELTIPASVAYAGPSTAREPTPFNDAIG